MNWTLYRLRTAGRTSTGAAAVALAVMGFFTAGSADAGQIIRPHRDTSSRTVETTGRVLIAVPQGSRGHTFLHRATRSYAGHPVRCGVGLNEPAKYVIAKLPARHRYDHAYDVCNHSRRSKPTLVTYRAADHRKPKTTAAPVESASSAPRGEASDRPLVLIPAVAIDASATRLSDLPLEMQDDAWALLNTGRYREARRLFEEHASADITTLAGAAIATAMSGDLAAGADALALLTDDLDGLKAVRVSPVLAEKLVALADTLYTDRPDAQRVLQALASNAA